MLSFIDKVTSGSSLVLVILKSMPVMLLLCSSNIQSFVHYKSSSTSQLLKGKSRDLQKLIRYLSGIMASTFKVGTGGGRGGWLASPSLSDYAGLSSVFPVILLLYVND